MTQAEAEVDKSQSNAIAIILEHLSSLASQLLTGTTGPHLSDLNELKKMLYYQSYMSHSW